MCELWIGPDGPDPVCTIIRYVLKTFWTTLTILARSDQLTRDPIDMKSHYSTESSRIAYEIPENVSGWGQENYRNAVLDIEQFFAAVAEIQRRRTNEYDEVCNPLSRGILDFVRHLMEDKLDTSARVMDSVGYPEEYK